MKVVLASKNRHKWEEIRKITEKFDMELVMESDLGVDIDVEETGTTFEENSFLKANAVMRATGLPALADDSGIAVDALNGEPGIYSARYGFDDTLDDEMVVTVLATGFELDKNFDIPDYRFKAASSSDAPKQETKDTANEQDDDDDMPFDIMSIFGQRR